MVLLTEYHDGGGKKTGSAGSALKTLQKDVDAVTEHVMFLVLFNCRL